MTDRNSFQLPKLPQRRPFNLERSAFPKPFAGHCVGCGAKLDGEEAIQQRFSGCRKCIAIYGRLDAAADAYDKSNRRETLERFEREVGR